MQQICNKANEQNPVFTGCFLWLVAASFEYPDFPPVMLCHSFQVTSNLFITQSKCHWPKISTNWNEEYLSHLP